MAKTMEERKVAYIENVYSEMKRRGYSEQEIPRIISKTGFMSALEEYPEQQLHYAVEDAVEDIMFAASRA